MKLKKWKGYLMDKLEDDMYTRRNYLESALEEFLETGEEEPFIYAVKLVAESMARNTEERITGDFAQYITDIPTTHLDIV